LGLVSAHSGQKHAAKPMQIRTPQALSESFDQSFCLSYSLESFRDAIRKLQSFSL